MMTTPTKRAPQRMSLSKRVRKGLRLMAEIEPLTTVLFQGEDDNFERVLTPGERKNLDDIELAHLWIREQSDEGAR